MDNEMKQILLDMESRISKRITKIEERLDKFELELNNMRQQQNTLEQTVSDLSKNQRLSSFDIGLLIKKTGDNEFDINRLNHMIKEKQTC